MTKYSILLDIDDTALIYSEIKREFEEHIKLQYVLEHYEVILYSGRYDIADFAEKWKTTYVFKDEGAKPTADFLVDDSCERWGKYVNVLKCFESIDSFLSEIEKTH